MPMNKSEKAAYDAAIQEAKINFSFRRTEPVFADVPPPSWNDGFNVLTRGWVYNYYSKTATCACSSTTGHAINRTDKTTSQCSIHLFSTEALALRALRVEVENQAAKDFYEIDCKIALAMEKERAK